MNHRIRRSLLCGLTVALATWATGPVVPADENRPASSPALTLSAPREVSFDADATFAATAEPKVSGTVSFELKTFAGETVWGKSAPLAGGQASVVLDAAEAAKLEKGSRVLVATLGGKDESTACAAVRLRGRIFRDMTAAPADIRPGDEIVITDTSLLGPSEAISDVTTKGKWWRRRYTVDGRPKEQSLVCVEEHDLDDPGSCLAGQLSLPLNLTGWYEVWVRTYRHRGEESIDVRFSGGIDVRLEGEKYFLHANPLQINTQPGPSQPRYGVLVDVLYRAADLTDQSLIFQQPYGTYESEQKRCNASLAGVRLVKLSDKQVAKLQDERAREDIKRIGFDNDGFSCFWKWAVHDEAAIARLLEPLRDQSTAFLNISLGGLGGIIIPTPYTEMYQMTGHDRDGDLRVNAFYRWCFENDVNIVDVLTRRAHEVNLKLFVSLMAERSFSRDKTMRAHPQWKVKRGRGTWNYAAGEVQEYQVKKIAWICENHDIDGFIIDFTRYGHHFNEDEPDKFKHMNAYLRKLRAAIDAVNAKKDRKVSLCGSFGDRSWHLTHWGSGKLDDQGLDVETWLEEGIFDVIMPEGPTALDFVTMAKDKKSRTKVWPRKVAMVTFGQHKKVPSPAGPKEIERGAKLWFDRGAAGIFFFNHDTWTTFGRLGITGELGLRTKVDDETYGMREGPVVTFASWYPNMQQRDAQRATFKPLTVTADIRQEVDATLTVPIHNIFEHPITAAVRWAFSKEQDGKPLRITPASGSVEIGAGKDGELTFRVKGNVGSQAVLPQAKIELARADQVVFRHSLPLRAVPQIVCRKVTSAPSLDGQLSDAVWTSAGGLGPCAFFPIGQSGPLPIEIKMALAYDTENLYLAYDYTGNVHDTDNVQLLVDPAGMEQEYRKFAVTPAGDSTEDLVYYYPFAGHFVPKPGGWNADWTARIDRRTNGYSVEMAIPLKSLGAVPKPGDVWRVNMVARSQTAKGKAVVSSWSSPETAFHLPRHLGTLFGTVHFE